MNRLESQPSYTNAMSETIIRLHIEALEEGGFVATSPDVQGLVAEGRSKTECIQIAQDVARKILELCIEHGDPIPEVFKRSATDVVDFEVPVQIAS